MRQYKLMINTLIHFFDSIMAIGYILIMSLLFMLLSQFDYNFQMHNQHIIMFLT